MQKNGNHNNLSEHSAIKLELRIKKHTQGTTHGGGGPSLPAEAAVFVLPVLGLRRGGILGANGFSPPAEAEEPSPNCRSGSVSEP